MNRHRRRRRHHCSRTSSRLQNTVRVHLLGRGRGARYSPPTLRPTPKRTAPPLSNMDAGLPSQQNDHKQMVAASTNKRHGGERRGEDARETIVTIELVSAQQGGACGVHRTHRDSGPGHSGFKRKQSSRGGATTASRLRKHPIYTFTTGARKRCPGERKGHMEYFGLLPSRSVPKGVCNHQPEVLGSGCVIHSPVGGL